RLGIHRAGNVGAPGDVDCDLLGARGWRLVLRRAVEAHAAVVRDDGRGDARLGELAIGGERRGDAVGKCLVVGGHAAAVHGGRAHRIAVIAVIRAVVRGTLAVVMRERGAAHGERGREY